MNKIVISSTACAVVAVFAAIASLAPPYPASSAASTTDLKCGCYAPLEPTIAAANPVNGYNLNCESNDRFATVGTEVSVQKSDLKVYIEAKDAITKGDQLEIFFRSRDEQRFTAAYDGSNSHLLWAGLNTDDIYQRVQGFNIKGNNGTWNASFKGETTGKHYKGLVLFNDLGNGKKTMTALCLQDH